MGAKADLLAFLIVRSGRAGTPAAWAPVETIANATSYSVTSMGRAAQGMVPGGFVKASGGRPIR